MAQEFSAGFYNSKTWTKCRAAYYAKARGLCEDCLARGIYTPGRIVHHVVPLTPENIGDPNVSLSFKNLRLLCFECHDKAHNAFKVHGRYLMDADGKILAPPPIKKKF